MPGALEPMLEEGLGVHGFSFYAGEVRAPDPLGPRRPRRPHPALLMLGQASTERVLIERLNRLGASVECPAEMVALRQDGDAIVRRTVEAGDLSPGTVAGKVMCQLTGPLVFRRLVTREPIDADFCRSLVALFGVPVANG